MPHFEKHLHKANAFMETLSENLGIEDKDKVYRIFKSVLHTLRDNISIEDSLKVIAQLPFILKAVYVENWSIKALHKKAKHLTDFLNHVKEKENKIYYYDFYNIDVERTCKIVIDVLKNFISEEEMNNIKAAMPKEIKKLFDNEVILI